MTVSSPLKTRILLAATLAWLGCAVFGAAVLAKYAETPGPAARSSAQWPAGTGIKPSPGAYTLVIFAHPQCPCTAAALDEVARLMVRPGAKLEVHVIFLQPGQFSEDWTHSVLWRSAAAIPGVDVRRDPEGREIARFGAFVSGQALLYDPAGRLRFSGGITDGRGHAGDNPGVDAIRALLRNGKGTRTTAPVFGCSLLTPHVS